jgi:aromatic-L-amino-acid decarboxylase
MTDKIDAGDEVFSALNPSAAEIRRWGDAAVAAICGFLDSIRDRRVYPQTSSKQIREKLDHTLPDEGVPFEQLLDTFNDVLVPNSRHNGHPRMFGYVQAPGTAIAAIADLLASTLNANLTAWRRPGLRPAPRTSGARERRATISK